MKLGLAAFAISGAYLVSHPSEVVQTKNEVIREVSFVYEILPATEACAWVGAGMMLVSAGKVIGNPLTVKRRLSAMRSELHDNNLYRAGWVLGALGAIGTSTTIAVGSVATLPEASWPLAFGVSAASITFSTIPFKPKPRTTGVNNVSQ